jgi:tetratricopeptide (TPR) repeat protein
MVNLRRFVIAVCAFSLSACSHFGAARAPALSPAAAEDAALSDFLVGRYAALTHDPEEAARRYARALATAPGETGIAERAVYAALLAGDYANAVSFAKRAEAAGRAAPLTDLTLGVEAFRQGRLAEAGIKLDAAGAASFNRAMTRNLVAWRIYAAEGAAPALTWLEQGLVGEPGADSATRYTMALIQMSNGDDAAALAGFETLWAGGLRIAIGVEAHAQLLSQSGDRPRAVQILTEFRDTVGHNAAVEALRARLVAGERVKPRRLTGREGAALAIYVPASALLTQRGGELSSAYFVLALALDPKLDAARVLWGEALAKGGRDDEALKILTGVAKTSPFYATARGQMAWALRRMNKDEAALAVAAEALAAKPDRALKAQLADLQRSLDRHADAEKVLTELIDVDAASARRDWRLLFARGASRERLGKWPEAKADLEAAAALQPENAALLNYLGYACIDRGENLEAAFQLIQRAVDLSPNSGAIIDSLGWAHYRFGRYAVAAEFLERAVALDPADPVLNDHLGDAYWQTGRELEAGFQWQRALTLAPAKGSEKLIREKLARGLARPPVEQAQANAASTTLQP